MMIPEETITIVRISQALGYDDNGRAKKNASQRFDVDGVTVAPRQTRREDNGVVSYSYENTYTLYFPTGSLANIGNVILEDDKFIVRGLEYRKDGSSMDWGFVEDFFEPGGIELPITLKIGGSDAK